jgi:hypothetical protein
MSFFISLAVIAGIVIYINYRLANTNLSKEEREEIERAKDDSRNIY